MFLPNTVFRHHNIETDPHYYESVNYFLESPLSVFFPAKLTSPNKILFKIKHLKNGKVPGHDLITARLTKKFPSKTIILLSYIFNSIVRLSYMSSIWKHAKIILIYKSGKIPKSPSLYRAISFLSILGKFFEKILQKE